MEKLSSKKILKNTVSLYFRTIILTIISLFTVRVVLQVLGENDYGTYNVVGGFVAMFSFVSSSLALSSQRYFAVALVNGDWEKINKFFSLNFIIYIILNSIIFILAETIGLWFIYNQLNIETERIFAAMVSYQLSVFTFLIGILISPFLALLIADENLSIYSLVSVVEGIFKVLICYLINVFKGDKLIIYAMLLALTSLLINIFYVLYTRKRYPKLKFKLYKRWEEYRVIFSFLNWNLIGAFASVCKNYGINIIINIFFGSTVNAAKAIATQMNGVFSSFSQNFMRAVNPQITKSYAQKNYEKYIGLIYSSSKLSYYLLFVVTVIYTMNADYILSLWLGEVPQYAWIFSVLVLLDALVLSMTDPFFTAVQVIGRVKEYQLCIGLLALSNLPVSAILLYFFKEPLIPFMVSIGVGICITIGRLRVFKKMYDFSILDFFKKVLVKNWIVSLVVVMLSRFFFYKAESFIELVVNVMGTLSICAFCIYFLGLDIKERALIKKMIQQKKCKNKDGK